MPPSGDGVTRILAMPKLTTASPASGIRLAGFLDHRPQAQCGRIRAPDGHGPFITLAPPVSLTRNPDDDPRAGGPGDKDEAHVSKEELGVTQNDGGNQS